jgi:hypothetical protein
MLRSAVKAIRAQSVVSSEPTLRDILAEVREVRGMVAQLLEQRWRDKLTASRDQLRRCEQSGVNATGYITCVSDRGFAFAQRDDAVRANARAASLLRVQKNCRPNCLGVEGKEDVGVSIEDRFQFGGPGSETAPELGTGLLRRSSTASRKPLHPYAIGLSRLRRATRNSKRVSRHLRPESTKEAGPLSVRMRKARW